MSIGHNDSRQMLEGHQIQMGHLLLSLGVPALLLCGCGMDATQSVTPPPPENKQTDGGANAREILDSLATTLRSFGLSERECEPGSSPAGAVRSWLYEDRKAILVHISEITPQTGPPRLLALAVDNVDSFPRALCH